MKKPPSCQKASAGVSPTQTRPPPAHSEQPIDCDRCTNTFRTRREYDNHRSYKVNGPCADHRHKTSPQNRVGYIDPDAPKYTMNDVLGYEDSEEDAVGDSGSEAPSDLSVGKEWCGKCKSRFDSKAQYNAHSLRCATVKWSTRRAIGGSKAARMTSNVPEVVQPPLSPQDNSAQTSVSQVIWGSLRDVSNGTLLSQHRPSTTQATPSPTPSTVASNSSTFVCDINGCQMPFRSEPGLKAHKADKHGVGGKRLDPNGSDSWMLSQRTREQLKREGLLREPPRASARGGHRGGRGTPMVARRSPMPVFHPPPPPQFTPIHPRGQPAARGTGMRMPPHSHTPPHHDSTQAPARLASAPGSGILPSSRHMGDTFDIEQAKNIHGKILRLLIQSDIFIHHDGRMTVCGIDWTRIGYSRQSDVVAMFDGMCHLPKVLQGEYLPPPKALLDDYKIQYPASEFEPSPDRDRSKPGLGVVALACSKVVLLGGQQEVVKIAAVDLITCRILMSHLVCTDPNAQVADWRSTDTGLFSWNDMEQARQNGFKVLKGWSAARSALWKFVDKETIIVGHNLRSDLDSLRMVHGRAVDIAKVAEKAAKGPLSKVQIGLDALCRDFPKVALKSDPEYGRDALMNAFGLREMGLWIIKNRDKFEKDLQQKSLDYQRLMPRPVAT